MTGVFQPTLAYSWPDAAAGEVTRLRPEPVTGPLTVDQKRAFQAYNLALPALATPDTRRAFEALEATLLFNQHRPLGGRRISFVTGPPHSGKTTTILAKAVQDAQRQWAGEPDRRPRSIPWIYVEATTAGRGRALAQDMCTFLGLPFGRVENAAALIGRLGHNAAAIGLRGIIIDDVHFLRSSQRSDQQSLANIIKGLVTSVPATFVFIGIDLPHSPLVRPTKDGNAPSDQLANRADWITFQPWPRSTETGELNPHWLRLLANLREQIALPGGRRQWRLDRLSTTEFLIERSGRRPGSVIEWVTRAANHAIWTDSPLDRAALEHTRPGSPPR